ncbi:TPA: cell division protein FtsN [Klebsiella quasipneumoniae subsp. quasipneumoniae]|uniref:cell division protein FtsN n=1 Tax=Klebsiella quasipneumoniae TaxID=1463165 RepID=UPI00090801A5|nr:cell division protein FtsN [Klebsiella quasipneumoniae]HBQ6652996.1 cell division protein FtsN [Klebsiella quasipneumoniae subsp. quasipneumoniae]HBR1004447.1 cell division protein FtsN [Klebsiella quasipneumoniae subsp. quasipneumoniae]HBR1318478.1 cell division protein FtsN [Klebsiella quasipneumoniae subsp. quasipneumoniae]HBR1514032.1 cell division protein FtsN [Klebsiella quasipneumoniae subsp. quasipneumoniae]HCI6552246.1 cell division protein FtsN [Klebsiella quasipneumoniae subsp. q
MAQRDYVRRSQPASSRRKKSTTRSSRNKQSSLPAISPAMVAIAAAVLVAFIGGLYFITHHKKEEAEAMQNRQAAGNGLPPKPEERWRYIKELESRQPGVRAPTEPTAGGEVMKPEQLTDEQRQLLAQMQADMRQQPTQLTEVPWNEQTPAQRQQTLQRQRLAQQQQQAQQQQWAQTQPQTAQQPPRVQQPKPVQQQQPKQTASNQQPYQDLLQTPAHTTTTQPRAQAAAPVTRVEEAPKTTAEKKDDRSWMIQCGSFKGAEQAETVRAQLAFEGFASHITTNNGWNRVVIGPLKGKESANEMITRLKMAGHANCIRLAARG